MTIRSTKTESLETTQLWAERYLDDSEEAILRRDFSKLRTIRYEIRHFLISMENSWLKNDSWELLTESTQLILNKYYDALSETELILAATIFQINNERTILEKIQEAALPDTEYTGTRDMRKSGVTRYSERFNERKKLFDVPEKWGDQ